MGNLLRDLRHSFRLALKNPSFTTVAVLTLGLGIGAATAIFSMLDAVMLRPLFKEQQELVTIWGQDPREKDHPVEVSYLDWQAWKKDARAFTDIALMSASDADVVLTGGEEPIPLRGRFVTSNFFQILRSDAHIGRVFTSADVKEGAPQVSVISYGLWQRQFGSDPKIVGRTVQIDGESQTIVGVLPRTYHFPPGVDLWAPSDVFLRTQEEMQPVRYMQAIARLKPGVSLEQSRQDMENLSSALEREHPDRYENYRALVTPLVHEILGDTRPALFVLLAAVGLLLLIACANVAGLLLARAASRQKETAVRTALGAGRLRLIGQLLTEGLVLALLAAALGLFLAWGGLRLLTAIGPGDIPRLEDVAIDGRALAFAILAALGTVLLFGLAPALQAASPDLTEALKEGGKSSAGRRSSRLRKLLVVGEVAVALVLLVAAGLMIRSFLSLQRIDLGFQTENVLTFRLNVPTAKYDSPEKWAQLYRRALEEIEALPEVEKAGLVLLRPLVQPIGWDFDFTIEGQSADEQRTNPISNHERTSPGYFQALGIPLVQGRDFTWQDDASAPPVAIVSESTARRYWPGQDPVGKRLHWGGPAAKNPTWMTVVGVVGDARYRDLGPVRPDIYIPYVQDPFWSMDVVARTAGDPLAVVDAVRRRMLALDQDLPLTKVTTMEQSFLDSIARPRLRAMLLGLFAVMALVLAAVGLYGIIAYSVTQRLHEIGIRLAVGADRRDVLLLVLRQGLGLTLAGLAAGLVIAGAVSLGASDWMAELLYEVGAHDLLTFAIVPLLLIAVALLASFVPARRATRVDPLAALRYE